MTTRHRPFARHPIVVAIDGPAGAGKSTVARRLADQLGYELLDTGAIYRAVALQAVRGGVAWDDEAGVAAVARDLAIRFSRDEGHNRVFLGDDDVTVAIRRPEISTGASQVSALPAVRAALLDLQRRLGAQGAVIAEGRDIGTVVFPDAPAKFYLTARPEVRARRRRDELVSGGAKVGLRQTLDDMNARDARDSGRAVAPLAPAVDAMIVDSSGLDLDEVVGRLRAVVRERERAAARRL